MSGQLTLDLVLPRRRARGREGFLVSASNETALAMLDQWRDWPDGRLALYGAVGVGKTHLAHVWMENAAAEKIAAKSLSVDDAPAALSGGAVVVEDVDRIAAAAGGEAEAGLFHLLNLAKSSGASVLLTGRGAPARWKVATPDLASRLCASTAVKIEAPDDALLLDLLALHLANRQLRVAAPVVRYIASRLERSAAAAADAARSLDEAALAEGRPITKPFAKAALGF